MKGRSTSNLTQAPRRRPAPARGRRRRGVPAPVAVGLIALLAQGCGYGKIHQLSEVAGEARAEIEVELQRRAELVPTLVETVKAYGQVSDDVLTEVAEGRMDLVGAVRSQDLSAMERASAELSQALRRLLAEADRHAGLLADPGFRLLRSQLEGTEEGIERAGELYNDAVQRYNAYIAEFPQLVTAKMVGADKLRTFDPAGLPAIISSADE